MGLLGVRDTAIIRKSDIKNRKIKLEPVEVKKEKSSQNVKNPCTWRYLSL